MIYLAQPYSDPDETVKQMRFEAAMLAAAKIFNKGKFLYSPILHCHPVALAHNLPGDFLFWGNYNMWMIERSDEVWVLQLEGWGRSTGVKAEIEYATRKGIPVLYYTLEDI